MAIFVSAFLSKVPNLEPKYPPYWVILDIWALLSFISVDILLAKTFLILVVCFVVRYNSCDNSSSYIFSYLILVLFGSCLFAIDFNLFNFVFVCLTLTCW